MRTLAALVVALAVSAGADAAGTAPRPAAALTASPARLVLARSEHGAIRVANPGRTAVVVDVSRAGLALGSAGRPLALLDGVAARRAAAFLAVRPVRLVLAPGAAGRIVVAAKAPPRGAAGDHPALVLLTAHPAAARAVAVRLRIGVSVVVRGGGKLRRRLVIRAPQARVLHGIPVLRLVVVNMGNVVEHLRPGALTVVLSARGRVVARLRSAQRELLPAGTARFDLPYRGAARGTATAALALVEPGRAGGTLRRRFQVRL